LGKGEIVKEQNREIAERRKGEIEGLLVRAVLLFRFSSILPKLIT
jgi:hypothetical protein